MLPEVDMERQRQAGEAVESAMGHLAAWLYPLVTPDVDVPKRDPEGVHRRVRAELRRARNLMPILDDYGDTLEQCLAVLAVREFERT